MSYIQLKKSIYSSGNYSVVPFREVDLMKVKQWRNEQIEVLRQPRLLTDDDQIFYYENHIKPSFTDLKTKIILFSFLLEGKCIGYGGLTNINWEDKRVELSFLLNPERVKDKIIYTSDFTHFIELMKAIVFVDLEFNRIFTETYDIRELHVSILEKCGFKLEGRMREHVRINEKFFDSLIHGIIKGDYEIKG